MTRSQMEKKIAEQQGIPVSVVKETLDHFINNTAEALQQGDTVTITGLGRFEMRERKTKAFVNPKTGVASLLTPKKIPGMKFSNLFKDEVEAAQQAKGEG